MHIHMQGTYYALCLYVAIKCLYNTCQYSAQYTMYVVGVVMYCMHCMSGSITQVHNNLHTSSADIPADLRLPETRKSPNALLVEPCPVMPFM